MLPAKWVFYFTKPTPNSLDRLLSRALYGPSFDADPSSAVVIQTSYRAESLVFEMENWAQLFLVETLKFLLHDDVGVYITSRVAWV